MARFSARASRRAQRAVAAPDARIHSRHPGAGLPGRRRGATVRAGEDAILVEIPRTAALKLMATVPAAKRTIDRIAIQRQLLQLFGSGLTPADLDEVLESAEVGR